MKQIFPPPGRIPLTFAAREVNPIFSYNSKIQCYEGRKETSFFIPPDGCGSLAVRFCRRTRIGTGRQVVHGRGFKRRRKPQRDAECGQCQRAARNPNRASFGGCQRARERHSRDLRHESPQRELALARRCQPEPRGLAQNLRNGHHHWKHRLCGQLVHPIGAKRFPRHVELQGKSFRHAGILDEPERGNCQRLVLQRQHLPGFRPGNVQNQIDPVPRPHTDLQVRLDETVWRRPGRADRHVSLQQQPSGV